MKVKMLLLFVLFSTRIFAHEGPAYPILVNKNIEHFKLSIFTDPDTGKGTFNFYLEGDIDPELEIKLQGTPKKGASVLLTAEAKRVKEEQQKATYEGILPFSTSETWNVEFHFVKKGQKLISLMLPVEVTPPGPSPVEFAVYFIPFLLTGLLWIKVAIRKKKGSA